MSDERMIDSEATTAGAVRQSGERCEQGPVLTEHEKEIRRDQAMKQLTQERDDLRRQLAQAEEREHAALAREAQMRRVVQAVRDDLDINYEDGAVIRKARSLSFDVCENVLRLLSEIPSSLAPADGPTWLRRQAEECHRLAVARGKYGHGRNLWTLEVGVQQIHAELIEWLIVHVLNASCGPDERYTERQAEEAGDALAALLSVMVHVDIDPAAVLHDAIERNRKRAGEGAHGQTSSR